MSLFQHQCKIPIWPPSLAFWVLVCERHLSQKRFSDSVLYSAVPAEVHTSLRVAPLSLSSVFGLALLRVLSPRWTFSAMPS